MVKYSCYNCDGPDMYSADTKAVISCEVCGCKLTLVQDWRAFDDGKTARLIHGVREGLAACGR